MVVALLQQTKYNWNYFMEKQAGVALACKDNRMPWPRGRALGGTTVINYMIYSRGNRYCYDKWGRTNPGWSYQDVLPYFIKSENAGLEKADYRFHGVNGYLSVDDAYQTKIAEAFIGGLNEMGSPTIDYNSNVSLGVSTVQATLSQGLRLSVDKAFLEPVKHRPNLRILTRAFVTKVLINPKSLQAYGVEYEWSGRKFKAIAFKEVILSAGTFMSPQLLMLSGIGPQKHLQQLGIPVLKNLPVGQNLQDHLAFAGLTFTTPQPVTIKFTELFKPLNYFNLFKNGKGPLTTLGGVEDIAYIQTPNSPSPDIELLFVGGSLASDYGLFIRKGMGITDDIYKSVFAPLENTNTFMIWPVLLTPKSKGCLKLRSTNPRDYPLLYGNYLTDRNHQDVGTFITSIRIVQRLGRTKAFRKFNATLSTIRVPGCTRHKYDSDEYWECCLRFLGQTLHHQVGTAKMGPKGDPEAVVDHELRVHGIKKLRVADCSVIPFALGAHTSAPAIMVGEKAADLIKNTWREGV